VCHAAVVHDGWSWFDLAWPWLGLVAAVPLLVVLLRAPRWHDPAWLGWLAVPVYLLHQVEEYGVDATGHTHAFPDALCTQVGLAPYPSCGIPEPFFVAVNCSAFWVAAPLAALLARRLPLVGLSVWGVILVNGLVHLLPLIRGDGYAPGMLTGSLLFLPLAAWTLRSAFLRGPLPRLGLVSVLAGGVLVHVVLMGSLLLWREGHLRDGVLVGLQLANGFVPIGVGLAGTRMLRRTTG
jgi:hypothetical protein